MLGMLVGAIRRHGPPDAIYLDNGATYRGDIVLVTCGRLGISLLHARPTMRRRAARRSASSARFAKAASSSSASSRRSTTSTRGSSPSRHGQDLCPPRAPPPGHREAFRANPLQQRDGMPAWTICG